MLVADFGSGQALWSIFWFFLFFIWIMILFRVFADLFMSKELSGFAKVMWCIFVILLPFLGVFVYVISHNDEMTARNLERAQARQAQMDDYIRSTAGAGGGAAAEIERAKQLLDDGAIDQAEFDTLKQRALAGSSPRLSA